MPLSTILPPGHRVSSGAQIKIAGNEGDGGDRLVTITGTPEAVGMAQYLINSRSVKHGCPALHSHPEEVGNN